MGHAKSLSNEATVLVNIDASADQVTLLQVFVVLELGRRRGELYEALFGEEGLLEAFFGNFFRFRKPQSIFLQIVHCILLLF